MGELTKLSETRWRFATAKRVYYIKRLRSLDEDRQEPGLYRVDGGGGGICTVSACSVEEIAYNLIQSQSAKPRLDPIPW